MLLQHYLTWSPRIFWIRSTGLLSARIYFKRLSYTWKYSLYTNAELRLLVLNRLQLNHSQRFLHFVLQLTSEVSSTLKITSEKFSFVCTRAYFIFSVLFPYYIPPLCKHSSSNDNNNIAFNYSPVLLLLRLLRMVIMAVWLLVSLISWQGLRVVRPHSLQGWRLYSQTSRSVVVVRSYRVGSVFGSFVRTFILFVFISVPFSIPRCHTTVSWLLC